MNPPVRLRHWAQLMWLAVLLLVSCPFEGQSAPAPQQPRAVAIPEMSAETIFSRFAGRILFLTCDESADESSLASGVLVSADGFIVTNAHVVEGCRNMAATLIRGKSRQSYVPVLKYYNEQDDVAVIKIAGHGFDFFGLPTHPAQIGERVYAIGNPRGLEQTISEGIISGNREFDGTSWVQHSAPISPGSSGGALISSRGELIGINAYLLTESQNLNFAVPAPTLATALKRARLVTGALKFPQDGDKEFSRALLYYRGQGVTQDYSEAARLLREAADRGHAEAQASLGVMFELGKGVTQDYAQAAAWYTKAAEQGFPFAQNALGTLLSEGNVFRKMMMRLRSGFVGLRNKETHWLSSILGQRISSAREFLWTSARATFGTELRPLGR